MFTCSMFVTDLNFFGSYDLTKHILNYSFITISMEKEVSVEILQ